MMLSGLRRYMRSVWGQDFVKEYDKAVEEGKDEEEAEECDCGTAHVKHAPDLRMLGGRMISML